MKRHLTKQEEFEIMKLVLDKFLWLGTGIIAYGFYKMVTGTTMGWGFSILVAGAILLILFAYILIREYEFMR